MTRKNEPDAAKHNPDPAYVGELVELAKKRNGFGSQAQVASCIGVGLSTLKEWKSGAAAIGYPEQFTLERLAGI
jgi:DNA-binding transcriptional regulator YiaG